MLGNLNGFDANNLVAYADMEELDQWALMRMNDLVAKAREAYDDYEFHAVYRAIYNFCVVDMSNFYLDVIKDRLYCEETDGTLRRSAQTAMYRILDAMVRLLSPILSFTSDEVWKAMPHREGDDLTNIVFNNMPNADDTLVFDEEKAEKWNKLIAVRDDVNKALEQARGAKLIGKPLEASVVITASEDDAAFLNGCGQDLAKLCIVSRLSVQSGEGEGDSYEALNGIKIAVSHIEGEKCARCWVYDPTVGENAEHPCLCARCASVLAK
jgi:isoleucyl-tRNA synthetase